MTLTLADANRVIAGAIEKANQISAKMNIAVCDAADGFLPFSEWMAPCGQAPLAVKERPWPRPPSDARVAI